ncbi:acyl-CoA dehydrogenase NM domain-like protein [Acaromyces ingoldii]|uniref:Acyl-CoA dehydrogenase NM domain-like protein n=1 Tax=Acaromyces ingoldii TaxID=215250 RepID=A0A316YDM8_9BASI|nr:acyl-CoA dehydrogenase NM domain-like protein [Acaromyces ingoldii]PWN87329.1 acyl-CoA dehydrogenase NM domain-like protein [Acaromyces ingoldii]
MSLTKSTTAFAEAPWIQGLPSPYFKKKSHIALREYVKKWVADNMADDAEEWDDSGNADPELFKKFARDGFLVPFALGVTIPKKFHDLAGNITLPGGVPADEWDHFHDYILIDELCGCGTQQMMMANYGGLAYGAGPIVHFASEAMQKRFLPDLLLGKKRICLAITEPRAGSDVAGLGTTAVKTSDGKHYIVNGEKKWITNGIYSDYFTTAVRTSGKPGDHSGITFLVIPRSEGLETRKMKMMGGGASGTTYVTFEDVKVPVENVVGKEGEGFKYIMWNFLHERMTICYVAIRLCRVCLEDSVEHVKRRKAFGKPLIEQPVVRHKIANMARQTEALQAFIEASIYQYSQLSTAESNLKLGGTTALLKAQSTITLEYVVSEAVMLFGGMGITKGGAGERVERIFREFKALSIPGGSQDVMLDLGVRQQLKLIEAQRAKSNL